MLGGATALSCFMASPTANTPLTGFHCRPVQVVADFLLALRHFIMDALRKAGSQAGSLATRSDGIQW